MKKKAFTILLSVLSLCALAGFTLDGSGRRDYYSGLLDEGIITEAEFEKLEAYSFELPESEKEPLDNFVIGEITQGREAGEPA